jgi:hypothetical protein
LEERKRILAPESFELDGAVHTPHSRKCDVLVLLKMLLIPLVYEQK